MIEKHVGRRGAKQPRGRVCTEHPWLCFLALGSLTWGLHNYMEFYLFVWERDKEPIIWNLVDSLLQISKIFTFLGLFQTSKNPRQPLEIINLEAKRRRYVGSGASGNQNIGEKTSQVWRSGWPIFTLQRLLYFLSRNTFERPHLSNQT